MINTYKIYEELAQDFGDAAARKLSAVLGTIYEDLQNTVTKVEFNELKEVVRELAQAQKRTEERLDTLAQRVDELAQAQKRTEERLDELVQAQKRTEERVDELAQAQKRTEERLDELAQAQVRTEKALQALIHRVDEHGKQIGGLSATVGYSLENEAYKHLPRLLQQDHGIQCQGRLVRDYMTDINGRDVEVNILGTGIKDGEEVLIVGESKVQLSRQEVDRFLRRVGILEVGEKKIFPVIVAHMISQRGVIEYAREKGVAVYLSYMF